MTYDQFRVLLDGIHCIFFNETFSQALHGLAPKCKLINMHELINKSTNNYVALLPLKNSTNLNTKLQKLQILCPCVLMCKRETSSYLKPSLVTLCHQEMESSDVSKECQFYLSSQNNQIFKNIVLCSIYANVNENFFVDLLIQLNQTNPSKASLCQVEDSPK